MSVTAWSSKAFASYRGARDVLCGMKATMRFLWLVIRLRSVSRARWVMAYEAVEKA